MKKRKVPHTFVIVFFIIVIAAVLTWIIPPGKYVTEKVGDETVMTFYYADQLPEAIGDNEFHAEPQTWQLRLTPRRTATVSTAYTLRIQLTS